MKFTCVKKDLEKALNISGIFIGKNLDLPVLSCVKLENKNNFLKILSTNIDTACDSKISIKSEKDGEVAVYAEVFLKTISNIKDEQISLETKENTLYLKTNSGEIKINTISTSDFPSIPEIETQEKEDEFIKIELTKQNLLDGLTATYYAASKSNIKPELSSIFINFNLKEIIFVATDGFRLAEKTIDLKKENDKIKILLPLESANQFIKFLTFIEDGEIELFVFKNQIFLKAGNLIIFSRLIDGDFVDYKKLIPEEKQTSIIFLKQDFIDISKLINIFTNDFNQVKINVKSKKVILSTQNKKGNNNTQLISTIEGEEIEMNFNHKYILDSIPSINTDSIEFVFNINKPLIINPIGDKSFQYIVMPLSK